MGVFSSPKAPKPDPAQQKLIEAQTKQIEEDRSKLDAIEKENEDNRTRRRMGARSLLSNGFVGFSSDMGGRSLLS